MEQRSDQAALGDRLVRHSVVGSVSGDATVRLVDRSAVIVATAVTGIIVGGTGAGTAEFRRRLRRVLGGLVAH